MDLPRPIRPERAAEAVAREIEGLILEGSLRPEEPLLPERELAERLGVSRPTLRDGLKLLEARGLLVAAGRGLKVAPLGSAAIADPLLALLARHAELADDYLEFRDIVETAAAALAAERASEIDHERLAAIARQIEAAHEAGEPAAEAEADAALHLLIYEASHNVVLLQIMRALAAPLRQDVFQNREMLFTLPATREMLRDQHLAIAAAILARDPAAARAASHAHLDYLRHTTRETRAARAKLELSLRRWTGGGLAQRV